MRGYLDRDFIDVLDEISELLRKVYVAPHTGRVLALSSTGTAGMEAGIAALLEPGETAIVGTSGYFGRRIVELVRRVGAVPVVVEAQPGEAIDVDQIGDALRAHPNARLVAIVHAETSTGVLQPMDGLGALVADSNAFLLVDCVTSLGGSPVRPVSWQADYCYSCTQKCLGGPPGLSPIFVSERALERITSRPNVGRWFTFDLELLCRYWIDRPPTYHHTPPTVLLYALRECLRLVGAEGLQARWQRHASAGSHLQTELERRGLELLAARPVRLPQLTAMVLPPGADGPAVQRRLRAEFRVEVGGALDDRSPPVLRIGLMGPNASVEVADRLLDAIDVVLA